MSVLILGRCSICRLNSYSCPGHAGHIELPVPVYNVTFMDQLLKLLRAKCVYCGHLKLHPAKVNLYTCKLRLLDHGLLKEADEVENIGLRRGNMRTLIQGSGAGGSAGSEDDSEDDIDMKEMRIIFTRRAIKKVGGSHKKSEVCKEKVEALSEHRRAVVKHFLGEITKGGACGQCNG